MAVPCTACQPSWSTPTQCIHCGAQAASSQPTAAVAAAAKPTREAGICFGFVLFSIWLFTGAPFTFWIPRLPQKGLRRGRRRRRGGQGSLTEDCSRYHPVAARRRGGCRRKDEEKQLPSQHLLQAAGDPPPTVSIAAPRSPLSLILRAFGTFLGRKAAAAAACPCCSSLSHGSVWFLLPIS